MYPINNLTNEPLQTMNVVLPAGDTFSLTLYYVPRQIGWFITNLTYGTFQLSGFRITTNPNLLYPWSNLLPFGLACFTKSNREPTQISDFLSGASSLYVLSSGEVEELIQIYSDG